MFDHQPANPSPARSKKPGALFSIRPLNTLSSKADPDFSRYSTKTKRGSGRAFVHNPTLDDDKLLPLPLRTLDDKMVNERAPPRVPPDTNAPLSNTAGNEQRKSAADDDDDITRLMSSAGFGALKSGVRDGLGSNSNDPFRHLGPSSQSRGHPRFGHSGMMSSHKQKANIFNPNKGRPEHHLNPVHRVTGPQPPKYKDTKAPPLQMFDTATAAPPMQSTSYADEVFYTDPNKASEDLKNLLEGVIDEEEGEDREQKPEGEASDGSSDPKSGAIEGLKVKLLPHQVEGVEWMRGRELGPVKRGKVPKGGILADDMGLGKTLQTISLILTNQKPQKEDKGWKKHYDGVEKTTLVVAPLALIRQWETEIIEKLAKSHQLKVCVHHGPNRTKRFKDLALFDVVITTYQILVSEHGQSSPTDDGLKAGCFGLHWWRVVLDEAHTIKNRNAKATKACCALRSEYRWCLSGTPMQNNLDELQSLVKFLRIKPYDDLKAWKEHIDLPMKNGRGHIAIRRLHSLLRCFMKRRRKEILKEAGALNPGGKPTEDGKSSTGFKVTERNVVTIAAELSPAERKFYHRLETRAEGNIENMMGGKMSYASALTLLLRMRQACNHPKLVAGKLHKDKDAMAISGGAAQSSQDADIDSMADMFAGMGIQASRNCGICGNEIDGLANKLGKDMCTECSNDLDYFNQESAERTKPKKHSKKKRSKQKVVKAEKPARRQRNRRAVLDSDDEEEDEEGSWLVPEEQRGSLKLGKAGGEEDENAEGGGDWIGPEDSEDDSRIQDQSNLSSFVVGDDEAKKEEGSASPGEDAGSDDDDDSLPDLAAITKKMASQTLDDKEKSSESDIVSAGSESDVEVSGDDSASDAVDDSDLEIFQTNRLGSKNRVVASAKIRELIKILSKEVAEHKFIVFSQFTSMLDLIEPFLEHEEFEYTRYDGSMKNDEREESLRKLRKDKKTRILLCSLKCGSLGLNLTAATRVVIIEPFWNPVCFQNAALKPPY